MSIPSVMSVRELRAEISSVLRTARSGTEVFIGPYRNAEAVLMSLRRYRELTDHERSVNPLDRPDPGQPEQPALEPEVTAARQLARGEIPYFEYLQRMGRTVREWS